MVNTDKVYLMTKAALFEEKEAKRDLKIVTYRRKDYISYHMMLVFLSVTVGYALIVGAVLFMIVMAHDEIILNLSEMIIILAAIVFIYIVVLAVYYVISHKYYGERHIHARREVKKYLSYLHQLEILQESRERQKNS